MYCIMASSTETDSSSRCIQDQVNRAKSIYNKEGRKRLTVIADQGDYLYILKLKLTDGAVLQIWITADEPQIEVALKGSHHYQPHDTAFLAQLDRLKSEDQLMDCLEFVDEYFSALQKGADGIDDSEASHSHGSPHVALVKAKEGAEGGRKKKRAAKVASDEPSSSNSTKSSRNTNSGCTQKSDSLKPAQDVISRVLWDDSLPTDRFTVGYLDRFLGVIEKPFASFNWQHFSEVDPEETSAIPRHRIQFFKFDDTIVWDKSKKLDIIFNSGVTAEHGSSLTSSIYELIGEQADGSTIAESGGGELLDAGFTGVKTLSSADAGVTGAAPKSKKFLGFHVRNVFKMTSFEETVYRVAAVGANAMAFFFQDPRTLIENENCNVDINKFQEACQKCEILTENIVPHGAYALRLGSSDDSLRELSTKICVREMKLCHELGIRNYNIHAGPLNQGEDVEIFKARFAHTVDDVLEQTPDCNVNLLLETSAGQGTEVGSTFEEIRDIYDMVANNERIGFCMDTCHIFVAGYDLRSKSAYERTMTHFDAVIGFDKLRAVHLNDSKGPLHCKIDKHEKIGSGKIGLETFARIINDRRFDGLPIILETPFSHDEHLWEITTLRHLEALTPDHLREFSCVNQTIALTDRTLSGEQLLCLAVQVQAFHSVNIQRRSTFEWKTILCRDLEREVQKLLPGFLLKIVGGTANGLGADQSDLDLCLLDGENYKETYWQEQVDVLRKLGKGLKFGQLSTEVRTGVVPVLRLRFKSNLSLDLSCNRTGLQNTHLFKAYAELIENFSPLCLTVKSWASKHGFNNAKDGYLNSYCFVIMVMHYLLNTESGVPSLLSLFPQFDWMSPVESAKELVEIMKHSNGETEAEEVKVSEKSDKVKHSMSDEKKSDKVSAESGEFDKGKVKRSLCDQVKFCGKSDNDSGLMAAELIGFFKYYSEFDYAKHIICVSMPGLKERSNLADKKTDHFLIYVEDPFELSNTSRCVLDEKNFEYIKNGFASAYNALVGNQGLDALFS